ncbi:MAG TPA: hypothetical protein EYO37_06715 [Nitrospina sp.]|nr:hypothetical protein [Nitrospina sp.]
MKNVGPEENHFVKFSPVALNSPEFVPKAASFNTSSNIFSDAIGGLTSFAAELAVQKVKGLVLDKISDIIPSEVTNALGFLSGLFGEGPQSVSARRALIEHLGSITLYTPVSLQEDLRPSWAGQEVGIAGAEFGNIVDKAGGFTDKTIGAAIDAVEKGGGSSALTEIIQRAAGQVVGGLLGNAQGGAQALRSRGLATNPHLEAFFKGIDFRRFSFAFKLAPKNQKEALEIQSIIESFKYFSLPGYAADSREHFFTNPQVWRIQYFNANKMHHFKHCALTGIGVNRAASGTNSTFYDNQPVEVDLSLTFMELGIITKDDVLKGF